MNEQTIAGILRSGKPSDKRRRTGWVKLCEHFASVFQVRNGCFDALEFLRICGVDE